MLVTTLLALSAVFVGLWLTGTEMNISSMMGMTMIVGIVTEVAIFYYSEYVDLTSEQRSACPTYHGRAQSHATYRHDDSGCGLCSSPLALGIGQGAAMQQPLAIAIISGLAVQLPLVLMCSPVLLAVLRADQPGRDNLSQLTLISVNDRELHV